MTPYQRGNRDGLLSLAKRLEAIVQEEERLLQHYEKEADKYAHPVAASAVRRLFAYTWHRLQTAQQCHRLALAAAEALPDDPEAP